MRPPRNEKRRLKKAALPINVLTVEQRWYDATATRGRRQAVDNAEAQLHEALRIVAELRETDLAAADDHRRWKLAWELQGIVHVAAYPLFKLVNDEHDCHCRRAS